MGGSNGLFGSGGMQGLHSAPAGTSFGLGGPPLGGPGGGGGYISIKEDGTFAS